MAESSIWYDHGGTYPEKNVSATSNHGFTVARHTRTANIDDPTRVTSANRKVVCQLAITFGASLGGVLFDGAGW
ncbi:hypothetical protein ACC693_39510, partial [Rhizobium ruizarguesonis]